MRLRRRIDPQVDCVFKALFGEPESSDLLIDLLNSVLSPEIVVTSVELQSPIHAEEFLGDDLIVVDVRARDEQNRQFQIEMQALVRSKLPQRILYCWADLFQHQLKRGKDYRKLNPVISIWLLGEPMYPKNPAWHHSFWLVDPRTQQRLTDHLRIDILELSKWRRSGEALAGVERWVYFLSNARDWDELPEDLADPIMRHAMSVLERFSELEQDYFRYQARMNALREREAWREEREMWRQGREEQAAAMAKAQAEVEAAKADADAAKAARDRLAERLRALGLDPDAI